MTFEMKLADERRRSRAEGRAETRAEDMEKMAKSICALVDNMGLSMDATLDALKLSIEDRKEIEEAIKKI